MCCGRGFMHYMLSEACYVFCVLVSDQLSPNPCFQEHQQKSPENSKLMIVQLFIIGALYTN